MPETWQEKKHPRGEGGQFSSTGGYSSQQPTSEPEKGRSGQREYESGYGSKPQAKPTLGYYGLMDAQLDACADALTKIGDRLGRLELPYRKKVGRADAEWREEDHPRGQPGNAGQFGPGGGGSAAASKKGEKSREPPSREAQVQAGEGIKSFLAGIAKMFPSQKSTHALINKTGRQFFANDDTYNGRRGTPKQCYKNAANLAISDPDKYTYVEGFVTVHGVPIEHAWVVDNGGNVVDPTIPDSRGIGGYFGTPFRIDYLQKTLVKNKVYGMFGYFNKEIYDAPAGEFVSSGVGGKKLPPGEARHVPPGEMPATSLFEQHKTPSFEEFLGSLPAADRAHVERIERKMKEGVSSDDLVSKGGHRLPSGEFTPERQKLHASIIREFLSPEKVKAARPERLKNRSRSSTRRPRR